MPILGVPSSGGDDASVGSDHPDARRDNSLPSVGSRSRSPSPGTRAAESAGSKRAREFGYDEEEAERAERFEKRRMASSPPQDPRFERDPYTDGPGDDGRDYGPGNGDFGSQDAAPPSGGTPTSSTGGSAEFWNPHFSDQFTINRILFVRNVPKDMTDSHLQDFLNRAMQSVKLCQPTFRPINRCQRIPSNPFKCALLCHNEYNARLAMNLNGIPIPTASYGDQNSRTAVELEIVRHSRFKGPRERPKHWNDIKSKVDGTLDVPSFPSRNDTVTIETDPRQDKRVFIGDLTMEVTQAKLLKFLDETMHEAGLAETPPPSSPDAGKPLFITCDLRVAPDKQRQYAIVEVRTPQEGLNMLHLNGINFLGSAMLLKTAGLRYPNPKMPGANWHDFQRRLHEKQGGGADPRRDGPPATSSGGSSYAADKPIGSSALRHEPVSSSSRYIEKDYNSSYKSEPYDDYRPSRDEYKRQREPESAPIGDGFQRKYEMLLEEYTELGKDFRRVSQSLAGASEQQRQLQEEIQVEKDRRRDAEWDLSEERQRRERVERDLQSQECRNCRDKERQIQDLQADVKHLQRQLQEQTRQQQRVPREEEDPRFSADPRRQHEEQERRFSDNLRDPRGGAY